MKFNLHEAFDLVEDTVRSTSDIREGMNRLLDSCDVNLPNPVWAKIRNLDFEDDALNLKSWLEDVLSNEHPSREINAFWFGLFNPVLEGGETSCRLYISGSNKFNHEDQTAAWTTWDKSSYLPEGRYANSKALHEIYRLVEESNALGDGEYILCLGYACLVVKAICNSLNPKLLFGELGKRAIAVGFDSGDFIILD